MLLPLYESIANRLHPLEQQHQHNPSSLYPNSIADSLPLASVSSRTTAESLAWSSSNSSSIRPAQNYPIPSEKSSFSKQSVDHQNTVNTLNTKNQLISMSLASSRSSDYRNMTFAAAPFTEHHVNNRDTSSTAQKMITDPTYHDDAPRPNGTEFLREDLTQAHFTPFMDSLGFNATSSSYVPHPNSTIGAATGGGGVFGGWMSETMDSILKGQTTDFQTSNTPSVCGQPTDAFHLTGSSLTDHLYAAQANGRAAALSLSGSTARCIERDQFNLINQHQPRGTAPPPPTFAAPYGGQNGYQSGAGRNYNRPVPSLNIMNSNAAGVLTSDTSANFFAGRSIGSTQALSVSAASPMNCSSMMTPDSSTAGYSTNRLGASSDESEVSPTPTNSSSAALTPNQTRKTAPTLATGRRNLKNEPVDPEEADRRMKRRERNRRSAQKCRERKVQRTHELQAQVECLQMEANRLTQELESWRNQARHCVALLQLHCPGVSIPYISCLNEPIERPPECITDACEELLQLDEHNTTVGEAVSTYRGTKSARKQQQHQTHSISNMTNTTANRSEEMQVVNGTPQASFGTLPTMVSLHSQQTSPGRSKSLFTFPPTISSDNDSPGGASKVSRLHSPLTSSLGPPVGGMSRSNHHAGRPESVGAAQRCQTSSSTSSVAMSVRESASASSSSSCSTYELPLVSCFDQPQQPQPPTPMHTVTSFGRTCGGDSSSHSNTNNNESRDDCTTTRVNVSTAVTSHVLNGASVEHISVVDLQPPHNKYDTVTMEEWNAAYLNSEAMNLGESGSISSISSSPRLNLLGTPSDVPDSNVGSSDLLN